METNNTLFQIEKMALIGDKKAIEEVVGLCRKYRSAIRQFDLDFCWKYEDDTPAKMIKAVEDAEKEAIERIV